MCRSGCWFLSPWGERIATTVGLVAETSYHLAQKLKLGIRKMDGDQQPRKRCPVKTPEGR